MATCKECYHTEVCTKHNRMVQIDEHTWDEYEQLDNVEKFCEHYTPTADVVEVRHGEWIKVQEGYPRYVCTRCHHLYNNMGYKYCPNCGAKMDGGKTE